MVTRVRPAADEIFDSLYPHHVRAASRIFWTPVAVALRAAALLERLGVRQVLDVGSGPGKFCLAAAAAARGLTFTGIEQRAELVDLARAAAGRLGLSNAKFRLGDALGADFGAFDALYFFNPFGENLFDDEEAFDHHVERSGERYMAEVACIEQMLIEARLGLVVVTYHGFGGRIPSCFELATAEPCGTSWLRVWVKRRPGARGSTGWLELMDGGVRRTRFFEPTC